MQQAIGPLLERARREIIIGATLMPPTSQLAELIALAMHSVVRSHMLNADGRRFVEIGPSLLEDVLDPYLGRSARQLGLARVPMGDGARAELLPIRPHPRTLLVLRVIWSDPGLSSREVGRTVGVGHSGHIWGILDRLERRGLIEDGAPRLPDSHRRAWLITPYGVEVLQLIDEGATSGPRRMVPSRARRVTS